MMVASGAARDRDRRRPRRHAARDLDAARATRAESRSKDVSLAAVNLEKTVLDMETGLRGYVVTGNNAFLSRTGASRAELRQRVATFQSQAQHDVGQQRQAKRLTDQIHELHRELHRARDRDRARQPRRGEIEGRSRRGSPPRRRHPQARSAGSSSGEDAIAAMSAETATRARRPRGRARGARPGRLRRVHHPLRRLPRPLDRAARSAASRSARAASPSGELSLRLVEGGPGRGRRTDALLQLDGRARSSSGRTDLEEQNQQLRASERAKSELVSIVSHEVRTPLASVLGFTSLLLNRDVDEETRRRYLEIIDAQGRRLSALLDDFLDVQRLEEGRLELGSERVDMAALLARAGAALRGAERAHRLELRLTETPLAVRGDSNRLAQVVGNLLSNAIKYSPEGGVVHVRGERANGSVRVVVEDEGLGIPDAQQERIFTKFYRGDAATSGIAGSGLGLAFARAVVEAHGGRIGFTSAEGEGSTFYLELPTAA